MVERRKQKELISVRVTTKFKKELEKLAEKSGTTLPNLVRYILQDYIKNNTTAETSLIDTALLNEEISEDELEERLEKFKEKVRKLGIIKDK